MGLCFSKKKKQPSGGPGATSKKPGKAAAVVIADDKATKKMTQKTKSEAKAETPDKNAAKAKAGGEEEKKKRAPQEDAAKQLSVVVIPSAPVRTSSCTKEEVEAILIQCGRLSRSSSGTGRAASGDTGGGDGGGHRRRRSGSKRSYDFDREGKAAAGGGEDGDLESRSRPSPQRKRSGSRERSASGGSRRASRSPGRRGEGGVSSASIAGSGDGERARHHQQQPGKMVPVPATEKGRAPSPAAMSGIRCASPRSCSPARMAVGNENACGCVPAAGPTPGLSRSSSRKAEQSPYRRNPMAEIDENALRNNSSNNSNNGKPQKKSTENTVAAVHHKATCRSAKEKPEIAEDAPVAASDTRAHSAKTNAPRTASVVAENLSQRPATGGRSRRASRDFDQSANSYASQILEDIQNYHEQHQTVAPATPSFSLPPCIAKACSILEAVADLNSSSENRTYDYEPGRSADDKGSVNALSGADSGAEPSVRRLVPAVRETEPQESAGSNSVSGSGIPLTPSWEPAVESTDRTWSTSNEVVDQAGSHGAPSPVNRPRQGKQRPSQPEPSGRSRAGSGNGSSLHRGRSVHRGGGSVASGRSGARVVSAAS